MRVALFLVANAGAIIGIENAFAGQHVGLRVDGQCPSRLQMQRALHREGLRVGSVHGALTVRVSSVAHEARMDVHDAGRGIVLTRRANSRDCVAIADAFAIIAAVHSAGSPPPAIPLREPPVTHIPVVPKRTTVFVGLSAGVDATLSPATRLEYGQLDLGVTRADRWGAQLSLARPATTTSGIAMLERTQTMASMRITRQWSGHRLWFTHSLGAGVVVSSVAAVDVGSLRRIHPFVVAGVTSGVRLSAGLSIVGDLAAHALPIADTYTASQRGEIGQSPRAVVSLGLGLRFETGGW